MCSVWWNRGLCAVCGGIGDHVQYMCSGIGIIDMTCVITGSTSAPRLTVMSTLASFILTPQAPEDNPQCVTDYNIIPAGNDGVMREDIPVAGAIQDLGVAIPVDGYDVCLYTYNFTIVATTHTGEVRMTVSQDNPIDLSGNKIRVSNSQYSK